MESPEILELTARQLEAQKRSARSDDVARLADQAWAETLVAQRHAKLVDIFLQRADAVRNRAMWLASQPAREELAEAARADAARLYQAAEKHRMASERHEIVADQFAAQLRQQSAEPPAPPPEPPRRRRAGVRASVSAQ